MFVKRSGILCSTPKTGIQLERDPSMDDAPYQVRFDSALYEHRLREDLDFNDETLSQLSIVATNKRTIRPFSVGYYNWLTKRVVLKPGDVWHNYSISMGWANEVLEGNLRHESKHAAQDLVEGKFLNPAEIAKSVAFSGLSLAVALGEYSLLNKPGFDVAEIAAPLTFLALNKIGQRRLYLNDPREKEARNFQNDPAIKDRWSGIITLEPRTL